MVIAPPIAGCDPRVDRSIGAARDALRETVGDEAEARRLVEQLAVTWTASLLVQHGDEDVADTYLRSRLDHDWGSEFGTLPPDAPLQRIASRAVPST